MADFSTDPFTQVHDALWRLLEGSPEFTALVRARNRINWQGDSPDPEKRTLQDADTPEVEILPGGGGVELWKTNTSVAFSETFQVQVHTTELRPNKGLNKLRWTILRALAGADAGLGLEFVTGVSCASAMADTGNTQANRGSGGWTCIFRIQVDMIASRADMKGTAR